MAIQLVTDHLFGGDSQNDHEKKSQSRQVRRVMPISMTKRKIEEDHGFCGGMWCFQTPCHGIERLVLDRRDIFSDAIEDSHLHNHFIMIKITPEPMKCPELWNNVKLRYYSI